MRRSFLLAAVVAAAVLSTGREFAAGAEARGGGESGRGGGGGEGGRGGGGGGGFAPSMGGGSFSRPAPPSEPMHSGGGEGSGGRLPSRGAYSAPAPIVRNYPSAPSYPRTSVPSFAGTSRSFEPNAVRPPAALPLNPNGGRVLQPGAPGEGFIRLPGGGAEGADSGRGPGVTIRREIGTSSGLKRVSPTGPPASLAAMPAIQQHLQTHGVNFQTWSAGRERTLERAHEQNAPGVQAFQANRSTLWNQLRANDPNRVRMAREKGADWEGYRRNLWNYRYARADEVRDRLGGSYDNLFTADWWRGRRGQNFVLGGYSPWWWWNPCDWNTVDAFGDYGWQAPIYYDYDANVVDDGANTYVDGQDWGSSADYSQLVMQLANPQVAAEAPVPPQASGQPAEWQPFGVFALTQQEKGDAIMFFQLAMNRDGIISGAFSNILTGDSAPVSGAVDKATQRAAWHVGDKTNTVYEAGVANLTQEVAPVSVHFDTQATQTWLLVRLPSPDLPTAPTAVGTPNAASTPAPQ